MKLVFFFLATSALFAASAIPVQSPQGSPSAANTDHVPKFGYGVWRMSKHDETNTKNMIINHYKSLEPGDEHKEAKLAYAKTTWRDGDEPDDEHMQYLDFNYHRGDTPDSAKIGQMVTLSRVRPPPEMHFGRSVPRDHRLELKKVTANEYKSLPPDQSRHVRSMKVMNGWSDGPGLREQSQVTYHNSLLPRPENMLGSPVTVYRPMSFLIDKDVSKKEAPVIKKRIRQEYDKLDDNHPLKQANYGVVIQGWDSKTRRRARTVGTTLYRVKDQLTDSAEEDFKRIGDFHVPLGGGRNPEVKDRSASSTTQKAQSP